MIAFVQPLVKYASQLMKSSARLAHIEDGTSSLVPSGWQISRYITTPTGNALLAATSAMRGLSGMSGQTAKMSAAVAALQAADLTNVTAVRLAGEALLAADAADFGPRLQAFVKAIQVSAPTDAITLLQNLAYSVKITPTSPHSVLLYVLSLCALSQSILDYTPSTSIEATTILAQYITLFDVTISPVSDIGWQHTSVSLGSLRANVLRYLQQQVSIQPPGKTQTFSENLPDVVVAYALYGDATRADQLVQSNDPINPMFMPMTVLYT